MHAIVHRLENGESGRAAKAAFAAAGFVLLLAAACAAREVYLLVHRAPPYHAGPLEFFLALLAVVCGPAGVALLVVGPGLFRPAPLPPRSLY